MSRIRPIVFVTFVILISILNHNKVETGSSEAKANHQSFSNITEDYKDRRTNDLIGLTSAQIVRLHGYEADVHAIDTQPGVRINLVHLINPAVPQVTKNPVLFIHGISTSTTCFMVNAEGARPRDLSQLNAANMSIKNLEKLLLDDPAARGLPFLLSNFGHDIWLMNRRATLESQLISPANKPKELKEPPNKNIRKQNLLVDEPSSEQEQVEPENPLRDLPVISDDRFNIKHEAEQNNLLLNPLQQMERIVSETIKWTFNVQLKDKVINKRYWDYSMDEQAEFDLPAVIKYILSLTGWPKLSIVAHSMGGAITTMMLADRPGMAKKLTNTALLAPAAELGFTLAKNPLFQISTLALPFFKSYKGPIFPTVIEPIVTSLINLACAFKLIYNTACQSILTGILGKGVTQLELPPANFGSILDTTGSMEYQHLIQSVVRGRLHKFDYGPVNNKLIYGEFESQPYDLARIRSKTLSIWIGNTDSLIPQADARVLYRKMRVPVEKHFITGDGVEFNHIAFLFHKNVTRLINIPILKSLQTPLKDKLEIIKQTDDYFDELRDDIN